MVTELEAASIEKVADLDQKVGAIQNGNFIEFLKNHPFEFHDGSASGDWPGLTFPSDNNDTNLQSYLKKLYFFGKQ